MAYAVINTMALAATNVDAYNLVGHYTEDIENGCAVTPMEMRNEDYTYDVALFNTDDPVVELYVVATPEVGYGEDAYHVDPRRFINRAGRPLSLKRFGCGEHIELSEDGFINGGMDTYVGQIITVDPDTGKFGVEVADLATATLAIQVEKRTSMTIGNDAVNGYILRRIK